MNDREKEERRYRKLYAGLQSYQFDDVCKIILVKQEAKDAE